MEAGPLRQPGADLGVLVGAVVVDDQVDIQFFWDGLLDLAQEAQELLVPVARSALGHHLPGGHVQRSKQGGGAVADVVMRHALHVAQSHGQQRLSAVQGLDLRLLVDAEHHRLVRRVQVQADDVPDLLDQEGVGGEFERLLPVRLHREGLQPSVERGLPQAEALRAREMPVAAARERALQCVLPSVGLVCRARLITSATVSSS